MDWIEVIQLKSFTGPDKEKAITAFRELLSPTGEEGLNGVRLFQSLALDNEVTIFIDWQGWYPQNGKSRLGVQLANAFSEFGLIYHSGWEHSASLTT